MRFDVKHRLPDGKVSVKSFDAESRAALFSLLDEQGISAISVTEAKSGGTRRVQMAKSLKPMLCILVGVVLAVGIFYVISLSRRAEPPQEQEAPPAKSIPTVSPAPRRTIVLPEYEEVLTNKEELIVLPNGVITNKPKTIAEAVAMVRLKPGYHRYKSVDDVFAKTNDFQIGEYKQPLFKTHIESHLSMIATMPRDRAVPPMPPMPHNMERDFDNALSRIIEISEDDSDEDVQTKIRVAEMKDRMRTLVNEEGMTVSQAYREIENEHNRLANMTQLYKGAYRKMVLTGDEDASAFLEVANEELRRAGACEFDENCQTINP